MIEDVVRFRRLVAEELGMVLLEDEARAILTDLAQFYFLTKGHERATALRDHE